MISLYDCFLDGDFEADTDPKAVMTTCPKCGALAPRISRFRIVHTREDMDDS